MQDWNKEYILHSILGIVIDYDPLAELKKNHQSYSMQGCCNFVLKSLFLSKKDYIHTFILILIKISRTSKE